MHTGGGGDLTYVMYRLPRDFELRLFWRVNSRGGWNAERVICHDKVVEHLLNGAPITASEKARVDVGDCGTFMRFPDLGDAVSYSAIRLLELRALSSPPVYEEDLLSTLQLREKLWKQMEAYAEALPAVKHESSPGAGLIERFRRENGFPPTGIENGQKARLEKIGEDAIATYYRCFVTVTAQMDAYGLYLIPKHATLPAALVIAQHGNNGSPESALFHGGGNYRDMIRGAAARGYVVFAPHLVTLDALIERPEVDRQRIAMIGLSLGGFTTLTMSALDHRIKVAVVACGFRYQVPGPGVLLAPSNLLPAIAPRPIQIQAGSRDPLVLIDTARPAASLGAEAYGKAGAAGKFDFEEFDGGHEFNSALAWAFLKKNL
jgi:dienelactone hydrolase